MITTLRKKLIEGKLGYKIVIWVIFLSFIIPILEVSHQFSKRFGRENALVTIDGTPLENRTVEHAIQKQLAYIARLRKQLGTMADQYLPMLGLSNPVERGVQEVVVNHLLDGQAHNLSILCGGQFLQQKMRDPMVVQEVMSLSIFDGHGGINAQALGYELQRMGKTTTDFEHMVAASLQRKILVELVSAGAYVSEHDVKKMFAREYQAKQYEILQFPISAYKKNIVVTDGDVETYFNQETARNKRYDVPEMRAGTVWQFPIDSYGITVSDEAVERYYNKHKHDQFVEHPAMVQIRKIVLSTNNENNETVRALATEIQKQLAENPASFAELARKHSDDSSSAKDGGLTSYFKRGQEDADIEKAAFLLEKDGDIAPMMSTKDGFVFIQRAGRKKKTFTPLASVEKKIRQTLLERKFEDQFTADTNRLLSSIAESADAFEAFAQQKKAIKTDQPAVAKSDTAVARALFQLKKGTATSYVEVGRGYVVQLTTVAKTHTPAFKTVQQQVKDDLIAAKALQAMGADVKNVFERSASEHLDSLGREFGASYMTTDMIKRDDNLKIAELSKHKLPVTSLFELTHEGERIYGADDTHGYVIRVKATDAWDEELYREKYQEIFGEASRLEKDRVLKGFVASLQRRATIKIDTTGLTQ